MKPQKTKIQTVFRFIQSVTTAIVLLLIQTLCTTAGIAANVELSSGGVPSVDIVVAPGASPKVQSLAAELAEKLNAITGGTFTVTTGDGNTGIAIGLGSDFTGVNWPYGGTFFDPSDLYRKEEYAIRSHAAGVYVGGSTALALESAVWHLLHSLGYRHLIPSLDWEIIPNNPDLELDIDLVEKPDFLDRNLAYHYNVWTDMQPLSEKWKVRNRLRRGVMIDSIHSNGGVISRNADIFAAHPEYLALKGTSRVAANSAAKFCNSNPGLQQLVADDVLARFASSPTALSISVDPSDGGNHCECGPCAVLGSVSDQVITLANYVATAVDNVYNGTRFIGVYGYYQHALPPSILVHPQVVVNVANAYIPGGYTVTDLIGGWQAKGAATGTREYFSINAWDRDLPGRARAASTTVGTLIERYYNLGVRFFTAEYGAGYGPCGLGNYITAQKLWNRRANTAEIVDDFLTSAFGPAKAPMADFYNLIDGKNRPLMSSDLIHRMYQKCQDALALTSDAKIRTRIYDLVRYTRYVELYQEYAKDVSQARFEDVMQYAYRIRHTHMVSSYALWRDWPGRTDWTVPSNAHYNVAESSNPWKVTTPFTDTEMDGYITSGIANNPLLPFTPLSFSDELVPAAPLGLLTPGLGAFGALRYAHSLHIWAETAASTYDIKITTGQVTSPGMVKIKAYEGADLENVLWEDVTPSGAAVYNYNIPLPNAGLHRLTVADGASGFRAVPATVGTPLTLEMSTANLSRIVGRWTLYFYVPKGTTIIGGYSFGNATDGTDRLLDSNGVSRHVFNAPGYWSVPVPTGEDGKIWRFSQALGQRILMTVPPYLARHADELLLPKEVVERDSTGFVPQSFSKNLAPANVLPIPPVATGSFTRLRNNNTVHVWAPAPGSTFSYNMRNNYYSTIRNLNMKLLSHIDSFGTPVDTVTTPTNVTSHPVTLTSINSGHHKIALSDGNSGYTFGGIGSGTGTHLTFSVGSLDGISFLTGRSNMYFYVPKGTTEVGGYSYGNASDGSEQLRDGSGAIRHVFTAPGFFSIPVPPGQDGKLWKFHNYLGRKTLHTVPPYIARNLDELLLPQEVINADMP